MNPAVEDVAEVGLGSGPVVRAVKLEKVYRGVTALAGLDLEIPRGLLSLLVGPNGCGKSTTFRLLLGLDPPTSGEIEVFGHSYRERHRYLPSIGALVDSPVAYPYLSGRRNLELQARLGGLEPARVGEALELVGLGERASDRVASYSLGMRQRLGLAGALLNRPRLVVLDEPLNGVDPLGIDAFRTLLGELADQGVTVVVSSHLLAELDTIADHVVIVRSGRTVFQGGVAELARMRLPRIRIVPTRRADLEELAAIAAGSGSDSHVEGDGVEVAAAADWAAELNRRAVTAGIGVSGLSVVRPSLEDMVKDVLDD